MSGYSLPLDLKSNYHATYVWATEQEKQSENVRMFQRIGSSEIRDFGRRSHCIWNTKVGQGDKGKIWGTFDRLAANNAGTIAATILKILKITKEIKSGSCGKK
jgi:predicted secreted protein